MVGQWNELSSGKEQEERATLYELKEQINLPLDKVEQIFAYLKHYGYLDGLQDVTEEIPERIKMAQTILDVEADGVVGHVTYKAMMTLPRCGLSDRQAAAGQFNQWLRSKAQEGISYNVRNYLNGLDKNLQEQILVRAWESWEHVCGVHLLRRNGNQADIIIDASSSPGEDFGAPGNVLAWAYLPQGSGHTSQLLMKFDLAETWIDDPAQRGILLENVACHEFGHLLGLSHTQINGELMYPIYSQSIKNPQQRYDIPEVVNRYGPSRGGQPPTSPGEIRVEGSIQLNGVPYTLTKQG